MTSKHVTALVGARFATSVAQFAISPFLLLFFATELDFGLGQSILGAGAVMLSSRLLAYPIGIHVDSVGPRAWLMASVAMCTASMLFLAVQEKITPWAFACAFSLYAIGGAGFLIAFRSMVPHIVERAELSPTFSYLSIAFNAGALVGPATGAWLTDRHAFNAVFAVCGICYLGVGAICMLLPKPANHEAAVTTTSATPAAAPIAPGSLLAIGYFLTFFLVACQMSSLMTLLAKYCVDIGGSSKSVVAFFTSQSFLVIGLLFVSGRWLARANAASLPWIYFASTALIALAYLLIGSATGSSLDVVLILAGLLIAISQSVGVPTSNTLLVTIARPGQQGRSFGVLAWVEAAGILAGSATASLIYPMAYAARTPGRYWQLVGFCALAAIAILATSRAVVARRGPLKPASAATSP